MSYFEKQEEFGVSDGKGLGLGSHLERLKDVYVEIVRPMVFTLKKMMKENRLINEAELFCTDLEFRSDDQGRVHDFIGDIAKKQDDVIKNIAECLGNAIQLFKRKLKDMSLADDQNEASSMRSLSLCTYIATYFRMDQNEDSKKLYYESATEDERIHLMDLWEEKE